MADQQEGAALYQTIQANTADIAPQLIYSDWLEEQELITESQMWRNGIKTTDLSDYHYDKFGVYGAFCFQENIFPRGLEGEGEKGEFFETFAGLSGGGNYVGPWGLFFTDGEFGDGRSKYCEYGSGNGEGQGNGDSDRFTNDLNTQDVNYHRQWLNQINEYMPKENLVIGKQMLLWVGRGFAWVGKVEEMYAPGCYRLSNGGMLCRTGANASWMHVASGEKREQMIFRRAPDGVVYTGPELHGAIEWKGDLPSGDVN